MLNVKFGLSISFGAMLATEWIIYDYKNPAGKELSLFVIYGKD